MFVTTHSSEALHIPTGIPAGRSVHLGKTGNRRDAKKDVQARQKAWLIEVLDKTQLKPSQLASGAKVSHSTLTRMLNSDDYSGTLGPETIERIKGTYKVPGPEEYASSGRALLIGLSEAARIDGRKEKKELATIIDAVIAGRPNVDAWRLKTMALESVGYIPGDIVFVRMLADGETGKPQDAVCAQVVDYQHGSAETVWRIFDPPFLVAASNDRTAYKPLLVDGERVKIAGIIEQSFRPHSLSATR